MTKIRDNAYDWLAWLLFAAVPVVIFWQSATSLAEQGAASGGPLENAALYPRVVATVMTAIVIIQALRLLLGRVATRSGFRMESGTPLAIALSVLFVAYLIALPYAGFHIVTPLLCISMIWVFGIPPVAAILGGAMLWIGASYIFEGLLNVVVPVGIFNLTLFR